MTPLLDDREAARVVRVSWCTLRRWRGQGRGPVYLKLGSRVVRYRVEDLEAWMKQCRVEPNEEMSE